MHDLILKEIVKRLLIIAFLLLLSGAIAIFTVIGVYDTFWNVPDKLAKIEQLTDQRDRWQTQAMELERYIKK